MTPVTGGNLFSDGPDIDADTGFLSFTTAQGAYGTATFTVTLSDGVNQTTGVTLTITIEPPDNHAPVAVADAYSTNEDTPLSVSAAGVLANDTDEDEDDLTAVLVSGPSHAAPNSFTLNSNGSFSYTPAPNYFGTDSFTYQAHDSTTTSSVTTVTLTITAVNDAPVAAADAYSTSEDTPLSVSAAGVLANDTDAESDPLTAVLVAGPSHAVPSGFTLNANGSFSYTPASHYFGTDSFTYKATDGNGGESSTTLVTLTVTLVNVAPVAVADAYTTNIETTLTVAAPGVLTNDTDGDEDTLSVSLVSGPSHAAVDGFTLHATGSFSYTPAPTYLGTDSFVYQVSDGFGGTASTVVTITVHANTDPTAVDDACTVAADSTANVLTVLANDLDPDNDTLTVVSVGLALHGTTAVGTNGQHAVYTPAPHFFGVDLFRYQVSDGHAGTAWATVWVTVENTTNDAPYAYPMTIHTYEDIPISILLLADDPDGDELTYSITTQPTHGTVTLTGDIARYTPSANYFGLDHLVFQVDDGHSLTASATVVVSIDPLNDPPGAYEDSVTVLEDSADNVISVLTNDSCDPDSGETLTVTEVGGASYGTATLTDGVITYTPAPHYFGPDAFYYTLSDGHAYSTSVALVSVYVTKVNLGPTAVDDSVTVLEDSENNIIDVLVNDSDPEGDALTITAVGTPQHGTATTDGDVILYTPSPHFFGIDTFSYTISDGTATDSATITVTITEITVAADAVVDSVSVQQDTPTTLDVLDNDWPEATAITTLTIISITTPAHGTAVIAYRHDTTRDQIVYTPAPGYFGEDLFTYTIQDALGHTDTATVSVLVEHVNHPPTADEFWLQVAENAAATNIAMLDHASTAPDTGETLALTENGVGAAAHGTAAREDDATASYAPTSTFFGVDAFAYTVTDGSLTATATVWMLVNHTGNLNPTAGQDAYTVQEDTSAVLTVLDNDSGEVGETLSLVFFPTRPEHGTAAIITHNGAHAVQYTPAPDYFGPDSFTYLLTDGRGGGTVGLVTLTVQNVADSVVAIADAFTLLGDATGVTLPVLANDENPDAVALTLTLTVNPTHGTAWVDGDVLRYTPDAAYAGADSLTYALNGESTALVTLTVVTVNHAPLAVDDAYDSLAEDTAQLLGVLANDSDPDDDDLTIVAVTRPPTARWPSRARNSATPRRRTSSARTASPTPSRTRRAAPRSPSSPSPCSTAPTMRRRPPGIGRWCR